MIEHFSYLAYTVADYNVHYTYICTQYVDLYACNTTHIFIAM